MPSVPNVVADEPVKLTKVEVSPGVVLKLSTADAAAYAAREAAEAEQRTAYANLLAGTTAVAAPAGPAAVPLTVLTRAELVSLAEARGLASSGSKAAIAARFAEDDADQGDDDGGAEAPDATPATD